MDDAELRDLLSRRGVGVLGLVTVDGPYLLPLSFGFDGDAALYFRYLSGTLSRKRALSEQPGRAAFLVYEAASPRDWESVQLLGRLDELPADEWDAAAAAMENAWRPSPFEDGQYATDATVYRFRIEDRSGIKHEGAPSARESDSRGD